MESIIRNGVQVPAEVERRIAERRVPTTSKATGPNPKDVVGSIKAAMLLFPPIAQVHAADAMMDGAGKYDPYNWRAKDILCTTYLHAAIRHVIDYWEGEECAPDSRAKHLGHAIATLGIVLDAQAHGCLIDDRPESDGGAALRAALEQVAANEEWRREQRIARAAVEAPVIQCDSVRVLVDTPTGTKVAATLKVNGAKSGRASGKKFNHAGTAKTKRVPTQMPTPARGYHRRGI